jgi:hypothetical protein
MHIRGIIMRSALFVMCTAAAVAPLLARAAPDSVSEAPAAIEGSSVPAPQPDLRPRVLRRPVLRLADLAELARSDADVQQRYDALKARRGTAVLSFMGAGLGMGAAAFLALMTGIENATLSGVSDVTCSAVGVPSQSCPKSHADYTAAYVAVGVSAALTVLGVAVLPRKSDLDDAVTLWNSHHPADGVAVLSGPAPAIDAPSRPAPAPDGDLGTTRE